MFTGIIEAIGTVQATTAINPPLGSKNGLDRELTITTPWTDLTLGESIAINGVCLTASQLTPLASGGTSVLFWLSSETLLKTHFNDLKTGSRCNLERAVQAQTRLSGHIVQGHIDGMGALKRITPIGDCFQLTIDLPLRLFPYCVEKGSIALNGISLTLNAIEEKHSIDTKRLNTFEVEVMIIPHTWKHTQLSDLSPGSPIHIEVDILAKYLERQVLWHHWKQS